MLARLDLGEDEKPPERHAIGRLPQGVERQIPRDPQRGDPADDDADRTRHLEPDEQAALEQGAVVPAASRLAKQVSRL